MFSRTLRSPYLPLLLAGAIFMAPVTAHRITAQEKPPAQPAPKVPAKPAGPQKPEVTLDNVLSADAYKMYGEVKNVGTLVSTGSIAELIDPVMKLADPPKEFKTLVKFIN